MHKIKENMSLFSYNQIIQSKLKEQEENSSAQNNMERLYPCCKESQVLELANLQKNQKLIFFVLMNKWFFTVNQDLITHFRVSGEQ